MQGKPPMMGDLAQLPYSEQVIKEAMRLYPPAGGVTRQPIHDLELGGYGIAKGSTKGGLPMRVQAREGGFQR